MDRIKETAFVIQSLNNYRNNEIKDYEYIKNICSYYDKIKEYELNSNDYKFLKYLANMAGVPHFYTTLQKFDHKPYINNFDLNTLSAIIYESTLHTTESTILHKFQKQVVDKFKLNKKNRFFLSASTSFGKTHLVYEVIKKMRYTNVVLIFPTIALLAENLERILSENEFTYFRSNYKLHTLSEVKELGDKNLFIYTPERFLSFIEKETTQVVFDFAFIDEIYKIDNDYIIDDQVKENERDIAYRLAVFYSLKDNTDILLAGPYMELSNSTKKNDNSSMYNFLTQEKITLLNYNDYEIVNKSYIDIKKSKTFPEEKEFVVNYSSTNKTIRLKETVSYILSTTQNMIIYCANRSGNGGVEYYSDLLIKSNLLAQYDYNSYNDLINHISVQFSDQWIVVRALKYGIGIHHGLIPKYIQKEIISLFNQGLLKILISTTTITEGVNTSAKNLIVLQSKKGRKDLKKFDAKNIAGRAGRFGFHYSGTVIDLSNSFIDIVNSVGEPLKHKNYDVNSPKDEIDLFHSHDNYLSDSDLSKKNGILHEQRRRGIPNIILTQYKVVSRLDKIKIYDSIKKMSPDHISHIKKLIQNINYKMDIDYKGFQIILYILLPIIKNQKLKSLIETKDNNEKFSILTHLVHFYLADGFKGSVNYHKKKESIDGAIRKTAEFVYNTLKYQTVKYLGVFNLMYRFYMAQTLNKNYDEIAGIDKLLLKFEYNAITEEGRIASDYGVPSRVLDYYENQQDKIKIKRSFDFYESKAFEKVENIINNNK